MSLGKRKSFQAGLSILIVIVIILAGTFAWFSFTQQAVNIFEGFTNPDVNLHDDFDEPNKDVYVENSGERPLYVRVRFDEFMQIDENIVISGTTDKNDTDSWHTHKYNGVPYICAEETHGYYDWVMGNQTVDVDGNPVVVDPNNGKKYYLPAPFSHRALFDKDGQQMREPGVIAYDWSLHEGDEQVKYGTDNTYMTFETPKEAYDRINVILAAAYTGTPYDPGGTNPTFANNQAYLDYLYDLLEAAPSAASTAIQTVIDAFLLDNGLGYWDQVWSVKESVNADESQGYPGFNATNDLESPVVEFIPIKRTLETTRVYTMAQWIADGTPTGPFWIADTDGWCYWGELLLPGQATGLLLSEVILNKLEAPSGVWYYGINVKLEAVTYDDLDKFSQADADPSMPRSVTEEGQRVLMAISGNYVFDMQATKTGPTDPVYTFINYKDNVYQLVTSDGTRDPYAHMFIYTGDVPPANKGDIYAGIPSSLTTGTGVARYGNSPYRVGATFRKDIPFGANEVLFTVANAGTKLGYGEAYNSGIVESPDGKHYIMLNYTVGDGSTKVAWLAVGASKQFEPLTNTGGNNYSDPLNVLIWTDNDEIPNSLVENIHDQEFDSSKNAKIGDVISNIDGQDWIVLAKPTTGTKAGKTLIITEDIVTASVATSGITQALEEFTTAELEAIDGDAAAALLTIQEAIDCFANNAARKMDSAWWIVDGIVETSGAISGRPDPEESVTAGLRVAVWIDSDKLKAHLNAPIP